MARSPLAEEEVLDMVTTGDVEDPAEETDAPYAMAKGMSVPVPKKMGSWWKQKINDALSAYEMERQKWDCAFRQYRMCGRESNWQDGNGYTYNYHFENDTDENIIRTNVKALMRTTYMQNPDLEFTGTTEDDKFADCLEYIIRFMLNKKTHPGINAKPYIMRWLLHGQLTNFGVLKLEFQAKEGSLEDALTSLTDLEKKLETAKSKDEIDELMAKLQLLYEKMPLLRKKGMFLGNPLPQKLIVDPDCTMADLSDANWVAEEVELDRDYINQNFYEKVGEEYKLRSHPEYTKQVSQGDGESVQQQVIDTVMNDKSDERRRVIDKNKVRCYYIWDKVTRRIYLWSDEDWKWPLWVYEDQLKLSRFFQHFIINFTDDIDGIIQPGEVSFYIGQVNTINRINAKAQEIRNSVFGALLYDKSSADKEEVEKLVEHLRNPTRVKAFGIAKSNGENKKMSEMVEAFAPPAMQYEQLFNTQNLRTQIQKMLGLADVDQGETFKANTTNDAVMYMQQNRQANVGNITDRIEEVLEEVGWAMSEILVSKYTKDDITELVGGDYAQDFTPMTVQEFNQKYRMTIAAGSIQKPDSEFKKQEALQVAQAVGQVGKGAPGTSLKLIIKLFQKAFSSFVVTKKDFEELTAESQANMTRGVSTNGAPPPQQPQ